MVQRGVGLAAPQISLSIRLFVIDTAFGDHPEVRVLRKYLSTQNNRALRGSKYLQRGMPKHTKFERRC